MTLTGFGAGPHQGRYQYSVVRGVPVCGARVIAVRGGAGCRLDGSKGRPGRSTHGTAPRSLSGLTDGGARAWAGGATVLPQPAAASTATTRRPQACSS